MTTNRSDTIHVDGPAQLLIAPAYGANSTLAFLGFTASGVDITERIYTDDVPTDENGGEKGPPADIQVFGETHEIRLQMTRWDETQLDLIRARQAQLNGNVANSGGANSAGAPITGITARSQVGNLLISGQSAYRLLIAPANTASTLSSTVADLTNVTRPRNYPIVIFREPRTINKGSQYSRAMLSGTAYRNGEGRLYDTNCNTTFTYV